MTKFKTAAIFLIISTAFCATQAQNLCSNLFNNQSSILLNNKQLDVVKQIQQFSESTNPKTKSTIQSRHLIQILNIATNRANTLAKNRTPSEQFFIQNYLSSLTRALHMNIDNHSAYGDFALDFAYDISRLITALQLPAKLSSNSDQPIINLASIRRYFLSTPQEWAAVNTNSTLEQLLSAQLTMHSAQYRQKISNKSKSDLELFVTAEPFQIDSFNVLSSTHIQLINVVFANTKFDSVIDSPVNFLNHDVYAHRPSQLTAHDKKTLDLFISHYLAKQNDLSLKELKMLSVVLFQIEHENNDLIQVINTIAKNKWTEHETYQFLAQSLVIHEKSQDYTMLIARIENQFYGDYLNDSVDIQSRQEIRKLTQVALKHLAKIISATLASAN